MAPIQGAISTVLEPRVLHWTNAYLNIRFEQDRRGIMRRIRCMRGIKNHESAERFCREHANSAIYSVFVAVITRSSPRPSPARASSKVSASRSTSCRPLEGSGTVYQKPRLVARELTGPHDPQHMASSGAVAARAVKSDQEMSHQFKMIYGQVVEPADLLKAVATYEGSLVTPGSRFDLWLGGDKTALSAEEQSGYQLFKSFGCISCHQGVDLGGNLFGRNGIVHPIAGAQGLLLVPSLAKYCSHGTLLP
jgi:hypothetical protein